MSSNADQLFAKIDNDDPAAARTVIERLMTDKVVESEFLDYKGADRITPSDVKKLWSKSLSAFANTGGGVLVWGVDCRKVKDQHSGLEVDEPKGWALASHATVFAQALMDLVATATVDVVEGVKIRPVPFDGGVAGCVVCLIPEGRNKPYRAMFADEKYYMRLPDRMATIPHSLLRSLFYPKVEPVIVVDVLGGFSFDQAEQVFSFAIDLKNEGMASAHEIVVRVEPMVEMMSTRIPPEMWEVAVTTFGFLNRQKGFEFTGRRPLHPSAVRRLCVLEAKHPNLMFGGEIKIDLHIFVRDGQPRRVRVGFYPQQMAQPHTKRAMVVLPEANG